MVSHQRATSGNTRCLIVGASHAGAQCALNLRRRGFEGAITVVGAESCLPYHRPPLSKVCLKGEKGRGDVLLNSAAAYEKAQVELVLGTRVESIDRDNKTVLSEHGASYAYDELVLAIGATPRLLPVEGAELDGVCYLRNFNDVDAIRAHAGPGSQCVVIGGGYIGLEAAASLRSIGLHVTLIESMSRVLQRVTSEPVSAFFSRIHQEEGVEILLDEQVSRIDGDQSVTGVELASGRSIAADLVIVGIGVAPDCTLASAAGLTVENGICVDEVMRTSDPSIYAIGDCTSFVHPRYDQRIRLESVQNANDQAIVAAKSIVGDAAPYDAVPWFWSDQFDVKLQIAGLIQRADAIVVRGDPAAGRSLSVLYLEDGKLVAVDAMNRPRDFVQGKKLILEAAALDTVLAADPEIALLDCVAGGDS